MCLTTVTLLNYYSKPWDKFWENNEIPYSFLRVLGNITNWIIPMITQLSCLIFGYIRYTKPHEENERPYYVTYFDPIVEYYTRYNKNARRPS